MHFTMKSLLPIAIFGLATCQYHYPNYNKFRPSPIDSTVNDRYNPSNDYAYNIKVPDYQPPSYPNYGYYPPARPIYNSYPYPPPFYPQKPELKPPTPNKPLFTPAQNTFPAESSGQLDNFNKFLQQEAADAQKSSENQFFTNGLFNPEDFGKSFVDVKFGGPHSLQYHYSI